MAARFLVSGGDGLWASTNNWSATSGGASGASAPTVSDDVTFDLNGDVDMSLNGSARACKTLTVTSAYTHTLAFGTVTLSVSGNINLGANMLMSYTSGNGLIAHAAGTITSNGFVISVPLTFDIGVTITLGDNVTTIAGVNTTAAVVINSNILYINGGIFNPVNGTGTGGTTTIVFGLTGSPTWNGTSGQTVRNNVTFNTSGTITLSASTTFGTATLTYTAGTIVTTGNTLTIASGAATFNTNGMSWNNVTLAQPVILNSLLTVTGIMIVSSTCTFSGSSGFTVNTWESPLVNITFTSGNTYTITNQIIIVGNFVTQPTIAATTPSSSAFINFSGTNANMSILNANFTDIDASGGSKLWVYNGTLTRTTNVYARLMGSYIPTTVAAVH